MSYAYATSLLVADIQFQLKDNGVPETRYSEASIRQSIKDAIVWSDPLGERRVIEWAPAEYDDDPQEDFDVIAIVKLEIMTPTRGASLVPRSLWTLERGQAR
jgi:hypothetical protein